MQEDSKNCEKACSHKLMHVHPLTPWEDIYSCIQEHQNQYIDLVFEDPLVSFAALMRKPQKEDFVEAVLHSLALKAWGHDVVKVIPKETADGLSAQVTLAADFQDEVAKLGDKDGNLKEHYGKTLLCALPQPPRLDPVYGNEVDLPKLVRVESVESGSIVVQLSLAFTTFLIVAAIFAIWHNRDDCRCCPCLGESRNQSALCCFSRNKEDEELAQSQSSEAVSTQSTIRSQIMRISSNPDGCIKISLEPERPGCIMQ